MRSWYVGTRNGVGPSALVSAGGRESVGARSVGQVRRLPGAAPRLHWGVGASGARVAHVIRQCAGGSIVPDCADAVEP